MIGNRSTNVWYRGQIQVLAVAWFAAATAGSAASVSAQGSGIGLEEVVSVGCGACDGPELFSSIQVVALGVDGALYVADNQAPFIRVFEPDGEVRTSHGRRGEGPGEYQLVINLFPLENEGLLVVDARGQRITRIDGAGKALATFPTGGFPLGAVMTPGRSDLILFTADWVNGAALVSRLRLGDGNQEAVELASPIEQENEPTMFFSHVATPEGGFVAGVGLRYELMQFDADGSVVRVLRRDIPRQRKSDEEIEAERDRRLVGLGRLQERLGSAIEGGPPPIEIDPFRRHFYSRALAFDGSDRLWVRTNRGPGEGAIFDVFDLGGEFIGEVKVSDRISNYAIRDDRLIGVVLDEYDVESVKVWAIRE